MAELAARSLGVLTTAELRACGLSPSAITTRRRRGTLHRLYPGVWAVGHAALSPEGWLLAAVRACGPRAVLSHWSAAILWRMLELALEEMLPHVTIPGPGSRKVAGLIVHRSSTLSPGDVVVHRGIPVTSPARTIMDLAAVAPERTVAQAVRRAQGHRLVSLPSLLATLERLTPCRGSRKVVRAIGEHPAPTRTVLEDAVLDLLLAGGIEPPDVNKPLVVAGRRVVPDFRWPRQRLIVEADGGDWHSGPVAEREDAERQALLEAHGERVLRASWQQVGGRRAETLRRIRAAGAPQRRESP